MAMNNEELREHVMRCRAEKTEIDNVLHGGHVKTDIGDVLHVHTKGGAINFYYLDNPDNIVLSVSRNELLKQVRDGLTFDEFYTNKFSHAPGFSLIKTDKYAWEHKANKSAKTPKTAPKIAKTTPEPAPVINQSKHVAAGGDKLLETIINAVSANLSINQAPVAVKSAIDESVIIELIKKHAVKTVEIKQIDKPIINIGLSHYLTETVLKLVSVRQNTMLVGPAGSGKTTTCEKIADALCLKFYPVSVGPQTSKSDLLGFIDAHGNYQASRVREAFETGGVLLLDEIDAAHAGVLTIINALLENGYCSFPDKIIKKHEDFVCICACNTFGRGGDRQYVGRNQLDAATLDRFAVIDFDYDYNLEKSIAGNDAWVDKVQTYRRNAESIKARVIISPRASIKGAILLKAGLSETDVENMLIFKGIDSDLVNKIKKGY